MNGPVPSAMSPPRPHSAVSCCLLAHGWSENSSALSENILCGRAEFQLQCLRVLCSLPACAGTMGPLVLSRVCVAPGPEPKLLVAMQSEVLSYGLRSGHEEVVLATDKDRVVFSLDYDLVERKVFWMDLATESIRWQDLNSGKKGTLVKGGL